jgi:hypothetical protein
MALHIILFGSEILTLRARLITIDINRNGILLQNRRVHTFWTQKRWRNFGIVEIRSSWIETKKIQIKLSKTNKMNEQKMPNVMLNYRPNGRRWFERPSKRLLDEAEIGLSRLKSCEWWRWLI